jgi:hypothetical protein
VGLPAPRAAAAVTAVVADAVLVVVAVVVTVTAVQLACPAVVSGPAAIARRWRMSRCLGRISLVSARAVGDAEALA